MLLPTFYDVEGVFRFSKETLNCLHVRNLNHKLLMWKLSARNSHINPAAIRHTRLIVYKFLFILGMPDFSSIPSTTLFFLDGEQRISNFRTWESNPVLSFPSVPIPLDPCSTIFNATNSILVPASPVICDQLQLYLFIHWSNGLFYTSFFSFNTASHFLLSLKRH